MKEDATKLPVLKYLQTAKLVVRSNSDEAELSTRWGCQSLHFSVESLCVGKARNPPWPPTIVWCTCVYVVTNQISGQIKTFWRKKTKHFQTFKSHSGSFNVIVAPRLLKKLQSQFLTCWNKTVVVRTMYACIVTMIIFMFFARKSPDDGESTAGGPAWRTVCVPTWGKQMTLFFNEPLKIELIFFHCPHPRYTQEKAPL